MKIGAIVSTLGLEPINNAVSVTEIQAYTHSRQLHVGPGLKCNSMILIRE